MSRLAVILVNFNGWRDTLPCVESLRAMGHPDLDVIVVDNGSRDDSVARLSGLPDVHLVPLEQNVGFAGACNAGMRLAVQRGAAYLWLLNNDTVVDPLAAEKLVGLAASRPDAHFFGSLIAYHDEPEVLWYGGGRFSRWTGAAAHVAFQASVRDHAAPSAKATDWVSGCSVLIRASSLETVGFLDESYFLYVEDVEWQVRPRPRLPGALILGEALVRHKVGRSTGTTRGALGTAFMSRNAVKLALSCAGWRLPLWLGRWLVFFVVLPLLGGRARLALVGAQGPLLLGVDGPAILARFARGGNG